jgi:hypothetical protein
MRLNSLSMKDSSSSTRILTADLSMAFFSFRSLYGKTTAQFPDMAHNTNLDLAATPESATR